MLDNERNPCDNCDISAIKLTEVQRYMMIKGVKTLIVKHYCKKCMAFKREHGKFPKVKVIHDYTSALHHVEQLIKKNGGKI